jgi:hypothetical protein
MYVCVCLCGPSITFRSRWRVVSLEFRMDIIPSDGTPILYVLIPFSHGEHVKLLTGNHNNYIALDLQLLSCNKPAKNIKTLSVWYFVQYEKYTLLFARNLLVYLVFRSMATANKQLMTELWIYVWWWILQIFTFCMKTSSYIDNYKHDKGTNLWYNHHHLHGLCHMTCSSSIFYLNLGLPGFFSLLLIFPCHSYKTLLFYPL